jgi:hypothetical protein
VGRRLSHRSAQRPALRECTEPHGSPGLEGRGSRKIPTLERLDPDLAGAGNQTPPLNLWAPPPNRASYLPSDFGLPSARKDHFVPGCGLSGTPSFSYFLKTNFARKWGVREAPRQATTGNSQTKQLPSKPSTLLCLTRTASPPPGGFANKAQLQSALAVVGRSPSTGNALFNTFKNPSPTVRFPDTVLLPGYPHSFPCKLGSCFAI